MQTLLIPDSPRLALDGYNTSIADGNVTAGDLQLIWLHELIIPVYASAVSLLIVVFHIGTHLFAKESKHAVKAEASSDTIGRDTGSRFEQHVGRLGGRGIFAFRASRVLAIACLCGLSALTIWAHSHVKFVLQAQILDLCILGVYGYMFILSLASITHSALAKSATMHLATISIVIWTVFAYRDLWPLATYDLQPLDAAEGWIIWAKIAVLTYSAIIVPLLIPRQYVPFDPENPSAEISPEQTACLLSVVFFGYLDPYIALGNRVPFFSLDQLPPLADHDYTMNLAKRSFPHMDPFGSKSKRHLFIDIVAVFWQEIAVVAMMLVIQVFSTFAMPIGIYRLLNYLSGDGSDQVRPWLWIAWMAVGPIVGSIAVQWYRYTVTKVIVQAQAIITQLIFNHALRVRVKAETSQSSATSDPGLSMAGRLSNLITTDLTILLDGREFILASLYPPMEIALCSWFLYSILGWSAFVGMGSILAMFPIPGMMAKLIQKAQVEKMKKTDARVHSVVEILSVIRMVKLFGWEQKVADQLSEKREDELNFQRKVKVLEIFNANASFVIHATTMIMTFMTYTLIMKRELTASRVFSSMAVFEVLQTDMRTIFGMVPDIIRAKVSLKRTDDFLHKTELLDQYTVSQESAPFSGNVTDPDIIGIQDAMFNWTSVDSTAQSPGRDERSFTLRIVGEIQFKRGAINLILGPTGSGKTSVLMALLGEMHYRPTGPNSYVQLPRAGGIAYAAQESWVMNDTVKNNIVFGAPYDDERYKKVIYQCCLTRDLALLGAGDMTEVGERGLTLSGGQKARITLARAVYSSADILLLDDVLAALDVHTSKWIVEKCLGGDLVHGRTVILVTHNIYLVKPIASFVVSLEKGGRITCQGTLADVMSKDEGLEVQLQEEQKIVESTDVMADIVVQDEASKAVPATEKLVIAEEVLQGRVSWPALKLYFDGLAGRSPVTFWVRLLGGMAAVRLIQAAQAYLLGYWASQYEIHTPSEVNAASYLSIYSAMIVIAIGFYVVTYSVFVSATLRTSRILHSSLIASVLWTTLRWLDKTPVSRIVTRCTQDIQAVDDSVTRYFTRLLELMVSMLVKFVSVAVISPAFTIPGLLISILGAWCGRIYLKPGLSVKREASNARAPVLGHFGAAFEGLISIRAYNAQDAFIRESFKRLDRCTRASRTSYNMNRWISIRIEVLASTFAAALAAYLVYGGGASAANTGFALAMAVGFNNRVLWLVRWMNEFELSANSLERIHQYLTIEQEPKPKDSGVPPAHWPSSGELIVENLSARYSMDGPEVLRNLTFNIKSGERIGIVGRTGSGKSSLTLALLRAILTTGTVLYDGIPTSSINLDSLRANITIIPQIPEVLSGTLRQNLDPFSQHDDAVLNDALRTAGLFSLQHGMEDGRLDLDSQLASGGSNLSVGQRQIIALARAVVRQSKVLILDEATSAIDNETDSVIQAALRERLAKDITVLTVAHRLQSVMDADKIMVLDAGHIVEYDTPSNLLKVPGGVFKALVDESSERDHLYATANSLRATERSGRP